MWKTDQLGLAVWDDGGSAWRFDARGGSFGIGAVDGRGSLRDHSGTASDASERHVRGDGDKGFFSLAPVEQDSLPAADEQYVRGDRWHVNCPQADSAFALRLAFQPIETTAESLRLELTISLQTDLLDTHPKIDIAVPCNSIESFASADQAGGESLDGGSGASIRVASSEHHHIGVLLGPHDSPFTTDHSTESMLLLRLFGDFLEKGVIRKARPWIVIDRSAKPSPEKLAGWRDQLCRSPLPLTP